MYDPQLDMVCRMFAELNHRYAGRMHSSALDWQVIKLVHPRYDEPIDQLVPLVLIDWK